MSFTLEYLKYAEHFVRVFDFPFYYRGEVYDPFNGNTLSDQDFVLTFDDYVESFSMRCNVLIIKIQSF